MKCSECDKVTRPFNYCSHFKWAIKDKHTEIIGCNIDGKLP